MLRFRSRPAVLVAVLTTALVLSGAALAAPAAVATTPDPIDLDVPGTAWRDAGLSMDFEDVLAPTKPQLIQTFTATTSGRLRGITVGGRVDDARIVARLSDHATFVEPAGVVDPELGPILATATFAPERPNRASPRASATFDQDLLVTAGHRYVLSFVREDLGTAAGVAAIGSHAGVSGATAGAATLYSRTGLGWYGTGMYRSLVTVELTLPVQVALDPAAPDPSGWYRGVVGVHYTCTPEVAACPQDAKLAEDGVAELSGVVDVAGTEFPYRHTVKVDATAPTATVTLGEGGVAGEDGWFVAPPAPVVEATDGTSGVASVLPAHGTTAAPLPTGTGLNARYDYTVRDLAGNVVSASSPDFKYDPTAPVVTSAVVGSLGNGGWYRTPVTVTWTCADPESGATCTEPSEATYAEDTVPTTVRNASTNGAGVGANSAVSFKIDRTAPVVTGAVVSGTPSASGVYDEPITVRWTCDDAMSGVVTCPSDTTVTGVGPDTVASATVVDVAGNQTSVTLDGLVRRAGAPALTVTGPPNGARYVHGTRLPRPGCSATSALGHRLACTGTTMSRTNRDRSVTTTYTAKAVDPMGLTSVRTISWTVLARVDIAVAGLPSKKKSGRPVLRVGRGYRLTVTLTDDRRAAVAGRPTWLKPVRTDRAGRAGTPATRFAAFSAKGRSWTTTFRPTRSMRGRYYKFGVLAPDGLNKRYVVVYVR